MNLRGLPARRLDKKGSTVITDELIGYDQDANPVCVRDSSTGNPGHRDFTYDAREGFYTVNTDTSEKPQNGPAFPKHLTAKKCQKSL